MRSGDRVRCGTTGGGDTTPNAPDALDCALEHGWDGELCRVHFITMYKMIRAQSGLAVRGEGAGAAFGGGVGTVGGNCASCPAEPSGTLPQGTLEGRWRIWPEKAYSNLMSPEHAMSLVPWDSRMTLGYLAGDTQDSPHRVQSSPLPQSTQQPLRPVGCGLTQPQVLTLRSADPPLC